MIASWVWKFTWMRCRARARVDEGIIHSVVHVRLVVGAIDVLAIPTPAFI